MASSNWQFHLFLILTLCLQETVGVEWGGHSLPFIDEEIGSNHYTSKDFWEKCIHLAAYPSRSQVKRSLILRKKMGCGRDGGLNLGYCKCLEFTKVEH
ncbi:hypothetical protein V6N13_080829 [Hibiscus sabdariffa]|uniref:Uncharacterized protein n=2 Tax=Hibiscus sabdariffa TaxID=183260 RepID=A0ABR2NSR7_9ROSI